MTPQYIPAGRTSIVKWGKSQYQMQTEFASIPRPRVTTTIFDQGRVLHKIEQEIGGPIESIEMMHRVEDVIKTQHSEISRTIREKGLPSQPDALRKAPEKKLRSERIRQLDQVERVYLITSEGRFSGEKEVTARFKKTFKHIFRELPELINVFASLPGKGGGVIREEGIYEVEPGRILLASTGVEFYLILLKAETRYEDVAGDIREILQV